MHFVWKVIVVIAFVMAATGLVLSLKHTIALSKVAKDAPYVPNPSK